MASACIARDRLGVARLIIPADLVTRIDHLGDGDDLLPDAK